MNGTALAAPGTCGAMLDEARRRIGATEARMLLVHVLQRDTAFVLAHSEHALTSAQCAAFVAAVERRARGEPVAYITGIREFYGRPFAVTPAVLIPRPETEILVELALAHLSADAGRRVLDLATGSGCVALSVAAQRPDAEVTATDVSAAALAVAQRNAETLGVGHVQWCLSDWFAALPRERYDVIVANPPYVSEADAHLKEGDLRFEPRIALASGPDGLDALRTIISGAYPYLGPDGCLFVEHGYDQATDCRDLFVARGYRDVKSYRDLAGIERVTGGRAE